MYLSLLSYNLVGNPNMTCVCVRSCCVPLLDAVSPTLFQQLHHWQNTRLNLFRDHKQLSKFAYTIKCNNGKVTRELCTFEIIEFRFSHNKYIRHFGPYTIYMYKYTHFIRINVTKLHLTARTYYINTICNTLWNSNWNNISFKNYVKVWFVSTRKVWVFMHLNRVESITLQPALFSQRIIVGPPW